MVSIYIYNKNRATPGPGRGGRLLGILMCSIQREYEELRSVTQGGIVIHSICSTPPEIGSELTKAAGNGHPSASLESLAIKESHLPKSAQCSLPADHGPCRV